MPASIKQQFEKLAVEISKREGNRSQARMCDIREIVGILCDILHESDDVYLDNLIKMLDKNGANRLKRKKKK
jgi:hypothetical protein